MPLKADAHGRIGWRWMILPSSPSGSWRVVVRCHRGKRHARKVVTFLVITRSRRAKGPIGDPTSVGALLGEPAGKGGGVCGPFEPGQCTCLAFQKRSDVYYKAVAHGVPAGGTRAAGRQFYVWDGEQWLVNARRAGIPTGSQPVAGALVVWGVPNSAAYGHVAYVERATSATHVLVSECGFRLPRPLSDAVGEPAGRPAPPRLRIRGACRRRSGAFAGERALGPGGSGEPPEEEGEALGGGFGELPSIAINPSSGLATAVAEGPSNSLYAYWQKPGGSWLGPLGIDGGKPGIAYSAPSIAINPSSGLATAVAEGPSNSLYAYWQKPGGSWLGPLGIDGGKPGIAYSAPSIAINPSSGLATAVAEGPSNSLYAYWQKPGGSWLGPLGIDGGKPGIAYSAPSIAINPSSGLATAVAEGPSNSLYAYWQKPGGSWLGPLGIDGGKPGIAYSAPSIAINPSSGLATAVAEGPSNSLYAYWQKPGGSWLGPLGIDGGKPGIAYSAPSIAINPSSGLATAVAEGPSNSLYAYWQKPGGSWLGPLGIDGGKPGIAYSAPSIAINPSSGLATAVAEGPSNSLYAYWQKPGGSWLGPLGIDGGKPGIAY